MSAAGRWPRSLKPTFWADQQLTGISTQALVGATQQPVDSWSLSQTFPATNDPLTQPSLWLSTIAQTGQDGTTPITLPPTSFAGTAMPDRVMTAADTAAGYSPITRFRLTSLTNTTGGVTTIKYTPADAACAAGSFPSPSSNATQCYPDYWVPLGAGSPVQDWFNLYAIQSKTVTDTTGGDPPIVTTYAASSPAWHYNNDSVTRSADTTWDQWRGFGTIITKTGAAPDPVTQVTDTYFQGKSKDCGAPGCTGPVVTLTSSRGTTAEDQNGYAGMVFEEITYDGAGGSQVTDVIHNATTIATTATGTGTWAGVTANIVDDAGVATYTALAGGGTRQSTVNYTYDSNGRVTQETDVPDTADPAESTCTTTTYGVFDLPAEQDTYSFAQLGSGWQCLTVQNAGSLAQAQAHAVSATQNTYDSAGNLTQAASGTGITAAGDTQCGFAASYCWTWQATQTATYDQYGRMLTSADADHRATTTVYTPAAGAEPASVQVTDPAGLVATATYDPAREQQLTVTDPAGYQTTKTYDALGRVIAQWTPGNRASGPAVAQYSYTLSNTSPSFSALQAEMPGGGYLTTVSIIDSLGQVREMQQQTASGGSDVTDITYNSDGWKALASSPYYVSGAPSGTLVSAASSTVPSQTGFFYDGAGRDVKQAEYKLGTQTWETDTAYGGNYVTVVPPAGGTSQTTFTDGRGLTTAIYQYHSGVTADPDGPASGYDKTSYTYTAASRMVGITDAAGNTWSWTYNLLGDRLTQSTPDTGTTKSQYDAAGQLMSVTDARGKTTSYAYDSDGRRTAEYDTTGGAAASSADQLASWTWDTLAKGKLTSATSYVNGAQYTEQVTGYNTQGLAAGTSIAIPGQGGLAGTYTQQYSYAPSGQETSYTDSAAGGLPSETVTTGYDTAGEANSLTGATAYASAVSYTNLGQPLQYTMGTSSQPVYLTDSWDPQTGRLAEQNTQTGTTKTTIDDLHYKYDDFGNVTSEADTPSGDPAATDVQCFHNDYLGRLVQAWAQAASTCAPSPSATAEGGAAPYWNSYTYDVTGNLTGVTATTPAGAVTTTTSTYPAPGSAQPHAISSQTTTAPAGTTTTSYSYNPAGQLTAVIGSQNQTYSWNDLGQLTQDAVTPAGATTAQNTTYTYDADGNLILVADPGTTTLYLNDEELSLDTSTGTVTGTRYYSINDTTIATRTGASSIAYLAGDSQGTDSVAIDAQTLQVTRRWFDPYGNPRGAAPASFPAGQKGFVGGTSDKATGLTDLGAREYQPALGSFISPDPVLQPYTPQNLNPYAYAEGNPATDSDPSGLCTPGKDGCPGTWHDDASGCTAPSYQQLQVCIANWEKQQQEQQKPKGKGDQPVCKPMGGQVVCIDPGDAGALQLLGPDRVKYLTRLIDDLNCLYGKGSHLSCAIDVVKGLGVSFMTLYA